MLPENNFDVIDNFGLTEFDEVYNWSTNSVRGAPFVVNYIVPNENDSNTRHSSITNSSH